MNRTAYSFVLVALLTGLLVALGFALRLKGYTFGTIGVTRLDELASFAAFMPLAGLYALAALLIMALPLRAAGFVHAHAATPLHSASLVILAALVGIQAARLAFGASEALYALLDWRGLFALAIAAAHLSLDSLRRNLLLRTLAFIGFAAAALACLFWSFRF